MKLKTILGLSLDLLLLIILLAACTTKPTNPSTITRKMIGTQGGSVETKDKKVKLLIPAGALAQETEISITPLTGLTDPDVLPGTIYDFGPDGTEFLKPVSLTLRYDPRALAPGDETKMQIVKLHDDGTKELSESQVNPSDNTVSAEIKSFSQRGIHCCYPPVHSGRLTATYNQDRSISLAWIPDSSIFPFQLERVVRNCTPGQANNPCDLANPEPLDSDYSVRAELGRGLDSFVDRNLGSGPAFHYYRVRAFSGQTFGPPSNVVRVTVFGAQTAPDTPLNFRATAASGSIVSLYWDFSVGAASYVLERKTGTGDYSLVDTLSNTDLFYSDKGLTPETDYQYRLKAVNGSGESGYAVASARTKAGCTDFTLALNATIITAPAGSSDSLPLSISRSAGFTDDIQLVLTGDTQVFASVSFDPATVTAADTQSDLAYVLKEAPLVTTQANLTIRAESALNPTVQCEFSFVLNISSNDDTAPALGISQPLDGGIVASPSLGLAGLASDDTAVTKIAYQLNGAPEELIFTGNQVSHLFSTTVSGLSEGSNTIDVTASDAAGNVSRQTVTIIYRPNDATLCQDFTITLPNPVVVSQLGNDVAISISRVNNFSDEIFFRLERDQNPPPEEIFATYDFNPASTTANSSSLRLELAPGAPLGSSFTFIVRGLSVSDSSIECTEFLNVVIPN